MLTCPYCNGKHVRQFREIWSSGTSYGSGTGYGVGTNGEAIAITNYTSSQTVDAARCSPPTKVGRAQIILPLIPLAIFLAMAAFIVHKLDGNIFLLPLDNMGWLPYAILAIVAFLVYKTPGIYIQRNIVFPELLRNWDASVKCTDCSGEFFRDGSTVFNWKAGVEDFSWKSLLHRNPGLKWSVKIAMLAAMAMLALFVLVTHSLIAAVALIFLGAGYVNLFIRKNGEGSSQ